MARRKPGVPSASEHALQRAVAEFLASALPPARHDARWTSFDAAIPLPGKAGAIIGAMRKARGVQPGWPDMLVVWRGRKVWIELKTPSGVLSPEQKDIRAALLACGDDWHLARSVEEVEAILWGCGMPLFASVRGGAA